MGLRCRYAAGSVVVDFNVVVGTAAEGTAVAKVLNASPNGNIVPGTTILAGYTVATVHHITVMTQTPTNLPLAPGATRVPALLPTVQPGGALH